MISERVGVTMAQLRAWNQLTTDTLVPNQVLRLTDPTDSIGSSLATVSFSHRVKDGESLALISARYGVSLEELRTVNKLKDDMIYAETTLLLPNTASPATPEEAVSGDPTVPTRQDPSPLETAPSPVVTETLSAHTVSKGDTLYSISQQYGVSVMALQSTNHLQSEQLYPGQVLRLP